MERRFGGILIMNFNKMPQIRPFDPAVRERIIVWPREVQFVQQPQGINQRQAINVKEALAKDPNIVRAMR